MSATLAHKRFQAEWFIDGEGMYSRAADLMENAKESIFFADWFFSPQVSTLCPFVPFYF